MFIVYFFLICLYVDFEHLPMPFCLRGNWGNFCWTPRTLIMMSLG